MKRAAIFRTIPITLLAIPLAFGVAAAGETHAAEGAVEINPGALLQLESKPPVAAPATTAPTSHTTVTSRAAAKSHRPPSVASHPQVLPLPPPVEPHPAVPELPAVKAAANAEPRNPERPPPAVAASPLVVIFGGTTDQLQPDVARRIARFADAHKGAPGRFLIAATAPAPPGENAAARRLSLARGQTVGTILHDAGIAPERIIVQALGNPPGAATDYVTLSFIP